MVLNDIHIDIMDYIVPASCTETEFRSMWAEFEWENKVSVNTSLTELMAYLSSLLASTNMKCLTPDKALQGECGFMAANLYAKSIFGEDALANVSLEKNLSKPEAPVTGHIRYDWQLQFLCGLQFSYSGFERNPREWLSVWEIRSICVRKPDRKSQSLHRARKFSNRLTELQRMGCRLQSPLYLLKPCFEEFTYYIISSYCVRYFLHNLQQHEIYLGFKLFNNCYNPVYGKEGEFQCPFITLFGSNREN